VKCARFRCGISRYYEYHPDGSRRVVERSDRLNGAHVEGYAYDPVSGRLASVTDTVPEPDVVHSFVWNPEGTLARWSEPVNNYDGSSIFYERFYEYSEVGFLTHHWRREGSGDIRLLEEFVYDGDNSLVHNQPHAEQAPSVPYTAFTVVPPQIETAMENISHLVGCPRKTICTHRLVYGVVILFLTVSFAHRTQFGITMSVPQKAKNIPCFWVDI